MKHNWNYEYWFRLVVPSSFRVTVKHKKTDITIDLLQVNNALVDLIKATKSMMKPQEWSAQPENTSGKLNRLNVLKFTQRLCSRAHFLRWSLPETGALISARPAILTIRTDEAGNAAVAVYNLLAKLQLSFLYVIGLIVMGFERMRNIVRIMKPVRVAAIES